MIDCLLYQKVCYYVKERKRTSTSKPIVAVGVAAPSVVLGRLSCNHIDSVSGEFVYQTGIGAPYLPSLEGTGGISTRREKHADFTTDRENDCGSENSG